MTELDRLTEALRAAAADGGVPVLATLISVEGSAYRGVGARMVVRPDDTTAGAISGGCLEKDVVAHAERVRVEQRPALVHYDLTQDDDAPWGLDMGCAAKITVLLEPCRGGAPDWLRTARERHARREAVIVAAGPAGTRLAGTEKAARLAAAQATSLVAGETLYEYLAPPPLLVIAGDGPDVAPLARIGEHLGWVVRVAGREDPLGPLDAGTAVVVMTHRFARDLALLEAALPSPAAYVGLLGPRRRTERLLAELDARGLVLTGAQRLRLYAPVGLDIGAESPEEIALAILAEIRAVLSGRPGGPLRARTGPIHDRRAGEAAQ